MNSLGEVTHWTDERQACGPYLDVLVKTQQDHVLSNHSATVLLLREVPADAGKWKVITNGSQENFPVQGGHHFKYSGCYDPLSQPSPAALTQTPTPAILELSSL